MTEAERFVESDAGCHTAKISVFIEAGTLAVDQLIKSIGFTVKLSLFLKQRNDHRWNCSYLVHFICTCFRMGNGLCFVKMLNSLFTFKEQNVLWPL